MSRGMLAPGPGLSGYAAQSAAEARTDDSPAETLATLMTRELGVPIDRRRLRRFLLDYWSRVSPLAHAIHDREMGS